MLRYRKSSHSSDHRKSFIFMRCILAVGDARSEQYQARYLKREVVITASPWVIGIQTTEGSFHLLHGIFSCPDAGH